MVPPAVLVRCAEEGADVAGSRLVHGSRSRIWGGVSNGEVNDPVCKAAKCGDANALTNGSTTIIPPLRWPTTAERRVHLLTEETCGVCLRLSWRARTDHHFHFSLEDLHAGLLFCFYICILLR